MDTDLLRHFPPGATPRPAQRRLLAGLGEAIAQTEQDEGAPRVFVVEAPPGVGKSHVAMTIARWSGSAYLLTSQKLLQEQYEREFGHQVQLVKGRDNYPCERYAGGRVPSSLGACRRRRGLPCQCPYARAKAAALAGPIFCTNTAYFLTLRQWRRDELDRRRVLIIDEAHGLESQLVGVFTARFSTEQMIAWFGAPLPTLASADEYRDVMGAHLDRLDAELAAVEAELGDLDGAGQGDELVLTAPSFAERDLLARRDDLSTALARIRFFVEAADQEWVVRHPGSRTAAGHSDDPALELVPLSVGPMARELLFDAAEIVVLSSAFLGPRAVLAECFGLAPAELRTLGSESPFPLDRRPIVYRPVGALSQATLAELEPAVFDEVQAILARHPRDKGVVHVPSYAAGERLMRHLDKCAPDERRRVIWIGSAAAKSEALEIHRASTRPTVLVSPSLREGVDLPDDDLRFQVLTKMPYPDLGDPWTAARLARDPRWYALETAKALVQAYGRSCRHAEDRGVTYVLDGQFSRFLMRYRILLPSWFVEAAQVAIREWKAGGA
jgi:ATP-dependent DNA helicase DinG